MMAKAIGIDLGTTNCCVYAMQQGQPRPVVMRDGLHVTPAVVALGGGAVLSAAVP